MPVGAFSKNFLATTSTLRSLPLLFFLVISPNSPYLPLPLPPTPYPLPIAGRGARRGSGGSGISTSILMLTPRR